MRSRQFDPSSEKTLSNLGNGAHFKQSLYISIAFWKTEHFRLQYHLQRQPFNQKLEDMAKNKGKFLTLLLAYHQKLVQPSFQSELANFALLHFVIYKRRSRLLFLFVLESQMLQSNWSVTVSDCPSLSTIFNCDINLALNIRHFQSFDIRSR